MFSDENMAAAPRVRSFKVDDTYSSKDSLLAQAWASKLEDDARKGSYRRDITCADLEAKGREVKLTYQVDTLKQKSPMEKRLLHNYSTAMPGTLEMELRCHLPLSILAMKAASLDDWPQFGHFKVLLATLLPPIAGRKGQILPCFRPGGRILKTSALAALSIFKRNARLLLEYLGSHESDVHDSKLPGAGISRYQQGAGSAAAFFIIGPFLLSKAQRKRNGDDGFSSIFTDANVSENVAEIALSV
jgi:hypothetical protein